MGKVPSTLFKLNAKIAPRIWSDGINNESDVIKNRLGGNALDLQSGKFIPPTFLPTLLLQLL